MKKVLFLICTLVLFANSALSLEVVYPKKNNVIINAKSTFFIGNSDPSKILTINTKQIEMAPDGGFAAVVLLKSGINTFTLKSGNESLIYKITRKDKYTSTKCVSNNFNQFKYFTSKENATLRETPQDFGMNRLSQLPKGVNLIVSGECGNFFKVELQPNKIGWIDKNDVSPINCVTNNNLDSVTYYKKYFDKEFDHYIFKTSQKVPFSIKNKDNNIYLEFFGSDNKKIFQFESKFGYDYYYDRFDNFNLKIRNKKPKRPTVTIDAGHGGCELGAVGCLGDNEKDINLCIAKLLKQYLQKDFDVIMTRVDDRQISLNDRVAYAKKHNSTVLISIHANALPDGQDPLKNRGTSVYYYNNQAKQLGKMILDELTTQAGTTNDKLRQKSLALVRPTFALCVLVEVAYMINPYDNMLLTDSNFQKQAAKAIADAIKSYFKN